MLIANDALAIDDEALRHAGRSERDLNPALSVAADALVGIAVAIEEIRKATLRASEALLSR